MMEQRRGRPFGRALLTVGLLLSGVVVAGCVPTAATDQGRSIGDLYLGFMAIAVVIGAVVFGLATFAVLRYRSRSRPGEPDLLPVQRHGDIRIELIWTAIPVAIVIGLFIATLGVLNVVEARDPAPAAEVHANAYRWGWSFAYRGTSVQVSGGAGSGPEIVLPAGRPVRVVLTSSDVIHAFFVPQFLFKRDAIPGRETTFDFTISEAGTYRGQCAEFCGILHSQMPFTVRAVSEAEFEAWLAAGGQASGGQAPDGQAPDGQAPGGQAPSSSPGAS